MALLESRDRLCAKKQELQLNAPSEPQGQRREEGHFFTGRKGGSKTGPIQVITGIKNGNCLCRMCRDTGLCVLAMGTQRRQKTSKESFWEAGSFGRVLIDKQQVLTAMLLAVRAMTSAMTQTRKGATENSHAGVLTLVTSERGCV